MAKRELIDKQMMLSEYEDILDCEINHPKYENTVREIIEEANEITKQEIVKPYLDRLKAEIKQLSNANPSYWNSCDVVDREDVIELIDNLLSESEVDNGNDN